MSVYLVRTLLLSLFIGIIFTAIYYFLKEEIKAPQFVKFKKQAKTYSIDFTITASATPFTQQQQAFSEALQKNIQVTNARMSAAKIDGKTRVINDSSYAISVNSIRDTLAIRDLLISNGRLAFYEVYTIQEMITPLQKLPPGVFTYLSPAQPTGGAIFPPYIGICKMEDSGKVRAFFPQPKDSSHFPADIQFMFGYPSHTSSSSNQYLYFYAVRANPDALTNKYISNAEANNDGHQPTLDFVFNAAGARRWEKMTEENIGRPIAICYNDKVMMAPNVISKITGGRSSLNFSEGLEQCRIMAVLLTSEELLLPAAITRAKVSTNTGLPTEALGPVMNYVLVFCVAFGLGFCIIWFIFKPGKNAPANP